MRTAVALYTAGRPYDAIRIAQAYVKASGGRIATLPDVFQLFLAQPEHLIFDFFVLTDSFLLLHRERRKGRRYCRGNVVHGSGLLADPELRAWFDEGLRLVNKKAVIGVPRSVRAVALPADRWQELRSSRLWNECESVKVAQAFSSRSKKGAFRSLLNGQSRALMGSRFHEIIEHIRASTPKPSKETERYRYDVWRHGSTGVANFTDGRLNSDSFRAGNTVLASALQFCRPTHSRERVTVYHWEPTPTQVLALPHDWQPSDPIVTDRFQGGLMHWAASRDDCFHPSEEALSGEGPFFLGKDQSAERYYTHRVCRIMDGQRVMADQDRLAEVEIEAVLGETVLPEFFDEAPLTIEEYQTLLAGMPAGAQGIFIDAPEDKWEHNDSPFGAFSYQKNVPVRYVKLRPLHERRFLTTTELLADPNEYLRRIGVEV